MKYFLFFLISSQVFALDFFKYGSLQGLQDSTDFAASDRFPVRRPVIFKNFEVLKWFSTKKECVHAIVGRRILELATGNVYTAYFTNEDDCDGGNSYGLLVAGSTASLKRVQVLIQDGDFYEKTKSRN